VLAGEQVDASKWGAVAWGAVAWGAVAWNKRFRLSVFPDWSQQVVILGPKTA
jgi:hypothetical protein